MTSRCREICALNDYILADTLHIFNVQQLLLCVNSTCKCNFTGCWEVSWRRKMLLRPPSRWHHENIPPAYPATTIPVLWTKQTRHTLAEIATVIGVHKSSVRRELKRNQDKRGYRPQQAHELTKKIYTPISRTWRCTLPYICAPGGIRTHNQQLRRIWVAMNNLSNWNNTSNMSNISAKNRVPAPIFPISPKSFIQSALLLSYFLSAQMHKSGKIFNESRLYQMKLRVQIPLDPPK